jgi:hypothetical protein
MSKVMYLGRKGMVRLAVSAGSNWFRDAVIAARGRRPLIVKSGLRREEAAVSRPLHGMLFGAA